MKKLSEIVHYLNELDKLDLDSESLSTVRYMDHVFHVATAFDFQIHERSAELNCNVEDVKQAIGRTQGTLRGLKQQLQQLIASREDELYKQSTHWLENESCFETTDYILKRRLDIDTESADILATRMKNFTDWRLPGLVMRPGLESFILSLVALDPLYLVDHSDDLLKFSIERFAPEYQRRLRPYVIKEFHSNKILEKLPDSQFGFVLAYNFFNYKPMELIKRYLEELLGKLRPGGTIIMTINDCDRAHGVALAEKSFMCYTPGTAICQYAELIGYELMYRHTGSGDLSWLELRRPGEITSLRGGQTLAKIVALSK